MKRPQKWEKNTKKASAFFSGKCHNSDILYLNLYLNRRFMGGSILCSVTDVIYLSSHEFAQLRYHHGVPPIVRHPIMVAKLRKFVGGTGVSNDGFSEIKIFSQFLNVDKTYIVSQLINACGCLFGDVQDITSYFYLGVVRHFTL